MHVDWRKLQMQDFVAAEVPSNLGERFQQLGESLKASLADAEREGGQAKVILKSGAQMLDHLARAEALAAAQLTTTSAGSRRTSAVPPHAGHGKFDAPAPSESDADTDAAYDRADLALDLPLDARPPSPGAPENTPRREDAY